MRMMTLATPFRAAQRIIPASSGWPAIAVLILLCLPALVLGTDAGRVCVLLIVSPLAEEAVFRVGLQEALLRRACAPWLANIASAAAFALAHAVVRGDMAALAVAAPALLVGAIYNRWRRLRLCVALHAIMNAAWLAWSFALPASGFAG